MHLGKTAIAIAVLSTAAFAQAAAVLTLGSEGTQGTGGVIFGCGMCTDDNFGDGLCNNTAPYIPLMFDAQPTAIPTVGSVGNENSGGGCPGGCWTAGDGVYVDFGPNYSQVSITATYELWRQWADDQTTCGPLTFFWSTQPSNSSTAPGVVAAPNFGFQDPKYWGNFGYDTWVAEYGSATDGSQPPVTPQAQYLIIDVPSGAMSNAAKEWVFVGNVNTPEPASLGVLALGSLAMLRRRRA